MAFPGLSATLRLGLTVAEGLNSYYCMAEDDAPLLLLLLLLYPAGQGSSRLAGAEGALSRRARDASFFVAC